MFFIYSKSKNVTTNIVCYFLLIIYKFIKFNSQDMYSQSSSWGSSCGHEQQISILQQKIMQVHSKLIDQLDICKQQELTIMELTRQLANLPPSNEAQFDTFDYQSFGRSPLGPQQKENVVPNSRIYYDHDSRQSQQTKNQLLQADLQAMRHKVLAQITEKNKLKEDLRELKNTHKRQYNALVHKNQELQTSLDKVQENYEQLFERFDRVKRGKRPQGQIEKMALRITQLEGKWQREKEINRQIANQKQKLENKIQFLQKQKQRDTRVDVRINQQKNERNFKNQNIEATSIHSQQKQINNLKLQIQKLNKNIQIRDVQFRQKGQQRKRKRGFQETKDLIRRLQETQSNMRRNRKTTINV